MQLTHPIFSNKCKKKILVKCVISILISSEWMKW